MKMKRRMYLQFTLAVLPLALILLYQVLSVSDLPLRVNRVLGIFHISLQASASYKDFLNGVNDAVDSGKFSEKTIKALADSQSKVALLLKDAPASGLGSAAAPLTKIQTAIAAKNSIEVLIPLKTEVGRDRKSVV